MKTKLFFNYASPECDVLEMVQAEILCSSASDDSTESFGNDDDFILY